jgi:hypothetical protein
MGLFYYPWPKAAPLHHLRQDRLGPSQLVALIGFLDARSGVVPVLFSEISRVDHDSAFDENLDNLSFLDVDYLAFVLAGVDVHHGQKF